MHPLYEEELLNLSLGEISESLKKEIQYRKRPQLYGFRDQSPSLKQYYDDILSVFKRWGTIIEGTSTYPDKQPSISQVIQLHHVYFMFQDFLNENVNQKAAQTVLKRLTLSIEPTLFSASIKIQKRDGRYFMNVRFTEADFEKATAQETRYEVDSKTSIGYFLAQKTLEVFIPEFNNVVLLYRMNREFYYDSTTQTLSNHSLTNTALQEASLNIVPHLAVRKALLRAL